MLAGPLSLCLVLALRAPRPALQETPPPAPGSGEVAAREGAAKLTADAQQALELLRRTRSNDGREKARELLREIVAGLAEPEPGGEPARMAYLLELDRLASELGSLEESLRLREILVELRTRLLAADHPDLLAAERGLAATRARIGDLAGAMELFESVLEARSRLLAPDHPDVLESLQDLATMKSMLGDLVDANELREAVFEAWTRLVPADHPDLLRAKSQLAGTRYALGDLAGANELFEAVLEVLTRQLPPDHPDLLAVRQNLAVTRYALGDLAGANELFEAVVEAEERRLPAEHPDLLGAKQNLAATRAELGDLAGARELEEAVLEARTRSLPPDHPDLIRSKQNLGVTRYALGDLAGALELQEAVLEVWSRVFPPDHPELLGAMQNLALTRRDLGDLAGARALEEAVLENRTRLLPPDHPDLLAAKQNLALTRAELGDLAGARELFEFVLEARTRLLPPDHPDLLRTKQNLAAVRKHLGDLAGAEELEVAVLEARARLLPPEHLDLLRAKQNLAVTRRELGDLAGARELLEIVLEAEERLLPADHPDLLRTEEDLALTMSGLGDQAGALELFEAVHELRARLLPPDHPELLGAKTNLAVSRAALGDLAGAKELLSSLLDGVRARAEALRSEAARPAREGARAELVRLSAALCLSVVVDPERALEPDLFATLESLRLASTTSGEAARAIAADPELARAARGIAEVRSRLNDLVAAGPEDAASAEEWRAELLALSEARDREERDLRVDLAEAGAFVEEVDARSVGAVLAPGTAAVSFLRYGRGADPDPEAGAAPPGEDELLAFVVRPGGAVERLELGPAAQIEQLVGDWRRALGKPIERGAAVEEQDEAPREARLGAALRERVLDPVLAAAGPEARALHVELDDVLFLVPLDALPLAKDERVGERVSIHVEPTLARLLRADGGEPEGGTLVALGGIEFDAEGVDADAPAGVLLAAAPPLERSGRPEAFEPLRQTRYEVEDVGAQYREAFGREPLVLLGKEAAKGAFQAAAPDARWLHVATHGWFASEAFKSQLDALQEQGARDALQRARETVTGFAPEALCGLALAGANRGKDALGRVPGILTAEELAAFDLRRCELAVLSACETNVGIRRAGQGIQSLQSALHAAGARTAITSLWRVDDAATRRLFELFYTNLWKEELGKADALWRAKMALRAEGHPPRDWAAWVLTGEPD